MKNDAFSLNEIKAKKTPSFTTSHHFFPLDSGQLINVKGGESNDDRLITKRTN